MQKWFLICRTGDNYGLRFRNDLAGSQMSRSILKARLGRADLNQLLLLDYSVEEERYVAMLDSSKSRWLRTPATTSNELRNRSTAAAASGAPFCGLGGDTRATRPGRPWQ